MVVITFLEFFKMKNIAKLLLLVMCYMLFMINCVKAETLNWCGIYFQENDRSYLKIVRDDVGIGSSRCSLSKYSEEVEEVGSVSVMLDFNRGRSMYSKWRKFSGHLIEVRGKYKNGIIDGVKLVRDLGR